ncbi:MAG: tyrosine-type recombinase/integrase [bacterium]|nr:tyrosine-type recombinase/integrase [bacterium]
MQGKISKSKVDAVKAGKRDVFLWDTETKGFGLKVTPAGNKIYIFQYRWPGKKTVQRVTLGKHGDPWTPAQARKQAEILRGDVMRGINPRDRKKAVAEEEAGALTIAELCQLYHEEGCKTKKPSTIATDKGRIKRHIIPLIGKKKARDIKAKDVRKLMNDIAAGKTATDEKTGKRGRVRVTGGKGTASRTVGLLGGIFTFAVQEDIRPDNPARGIKRFRDRKNERYLSPLELSQLGKAMKEAEEEGENTTAIAALRLLVLSGCRKSEVLSLKWQEVSFEHGCLRLGDSKTNEKIVPLGAPALELLDGLPRFGQSPFVFPSHRTEGHFVGLPRVWERVRARAGLDGVRLHDLRHSFASVGAGAGLGLPIVGKLLGHREPKTTARYAHIADDPAKAAADRIAGNIASAMDSLEDEAELQFTLKQRKN